MESGSETYFDSVEEVSDFAKTAPAMRLLPQKPCKKNEVTEDDIIPYYDKAACKTEINLDKGISTLRRKSKTTTKRYNPHCYSPQSKFKSKSYLDMFRAKFGLDVSKAQNDSHTLTSLTSSNCLAFNDNVNSIYIKSAYEESSSSCFSRNSSRNADFLLSLTNLDSYKETESETETPTMQSRFQHVSNKNRSPMTITNNVPVLGKLGPTIPTDKLELLKKRQQYGMKVSQTNRIRMVEKKALRDLEKQIKESKIVCK